MLGAKVYQNFNRIKFKLRKKGYRHYRLLKLIKD